MTGCVSPPEPGCLECGHVDWLHYALGHVGCHDLTCPCERVNPPGPRNVSGHRLTSRMGAAVCECGVVLGGHEGTALDWHAKHLAERVLPPGQEADK